jgi:hypothetical protein
MARDKCKAKLYQKAYRQHNNIVNNQVRILKRLRARLAKIVDDGEKIMTKPGKAGKATKVIKAIMKIKEDRTRLAVLIARQELYVVAVKKVMKDRNAAGAATTHERTRQNIPSVSDYEQVRLKNIQKNKEFLLALGIGNSEIAGEKATKESAAVAVAVAGADEMADKQLWLSVGDAFLESFMLPPLDDKKVIPEGALVGVCFDISPGYFFGRIGVREQRAKEGKKSVEWGHFVHFTDGDRGWYPDSVGLLRLILVNEVLTLSHFCSVFVDVESKMGKGVEIMVSRKLK